VTSLFQNIVSTMQRIKIKIIACMCDLKSAKSNVAIVTSEETPNLIINYCITMDIFTLIYTVIVIVTGQAHKATLALRTFLICCASSSKFQSFLSQKTKLSGNYQYIHILAKQKKLE
jgi:hypothetical protein